MNLISFGGIIPDSIVLCLALALLVSAVGFWRYVYFISIGYGYSIAALGIVAFVLFGSHSSVLTGIQGILLIVYGLRLGTYLIVRETKQSYRQTQQGDADRQKPMAFGVKISIWVTVSILYVIMFLPALARFENEARGTLDSLPVLSVIGVVIMALGLFLEGLADAQKNAAKKVNPARFCDVGLFRVVRYPNYFGEILVWTGNLVAGASLLGSWLSWILAVVGFVAIVLVMIGSGRRLELKQEERYGQNPEFQAYVARTPALIPFLPIFSLKNAKVYLG